LFPRRAWERDQISRASQLKKGTHPTAHPLLDWISWRLSSRRRDIDAATFAVEQHFAIDECEQRVVFALADAFAGVELVADLADEDVASDNFFATVFLYTTALGIGIAAVAA